MILTTTPSNQGNTTFNVFEIVSEQCDSYWLLRSSYPSDYSTPFKTSSLVLQESVISHCPQHVQSNKELRGHRSEHLVGCDRKERHGVPDPSAYLYVKTCRVFLGEVLNSGLKHRREDWRHLERDNPSYKNVDRDVLRERVIRPLESL